MKYLPVLFSLLSLPAGAAVVSTNLINESADGYDSGITTSLITNGQSSLQGVTVSPTPSLSFSPGGVNDGLAVGTTGGPTFAQSQATLTFFENLSATPATITFDLAGAYNITSVVSLAGWGDSYFGSQQFTLAFETNDSGIYNALPGIFGVTPYTGVPPEGFPGVADSGYATKTTITDNSAPFLATNVTGVRFVFTDPYPSIPSLNGIVIRELSVYGSPVPEPATALLGALGVLGLLRRRR